MSTEKTGVGDNVVRLSHIVWSHVWRLLSSRDCVVAAEAFFPLVALGSRRLVDEQCRRSPLCAVAECASLECFRCSHWIAFRYCSSGGDPPSPVPGSSSSPLPPPWRPRALLLRDVASVSAFHAALQSLGYLCPAIGREPTSRAVALCCSRGSVAGARWWLSTFARPMMVKPDPATAPANTTTTASDSDDIDESFLDRPGVCSVSGDGVTMALQLACMGGHMGAIQWLDATFGLAAKHFCDRLCYAFRLACGTGKMELVEWLATRFSLTSQQACCFECDALQCACKSGNLKLVKWLATTYSITVLGPNRINSCFAQSCLLGHRDIAEWLSATFARVGQDYAVDILLPGLCAFGRLDLLKWVVDMWDLPMRQSLSGYGLSSAKREFQFTHCIGTNTLELCCERKHLDIAEWLTSRGMPIAPGSFVVSCARADIETAKWVASKIGQTPAELARYNHCEALAQACSNGQLETAKWLVSCGGLVYADLRVKGNQLLLETCQSDRIEVVKWLVLDCGLKRDDVRQVLSRVKTPPMSASIEWCLSYTSKGSP